MESKDNFVEHALPARLLRFGFIPATAARESFSCGFRLDVPGWGLLVHAGLIRKCQTP